MLPNACLSGGAGLNSNRAAPLVLVSESGIYLVRAGACCVAAESIGAGGLAGRYATALFELADERKALDEVEGDLDALAGLLAESPELTRLVRSPVISRADQGRAMDAVLEKGGASKLTRRFIGLLAQKRRLFALTAIIGAFRAMLATHRGEIAAEVTSAQPLRPEQLEAVTKAIKDSVGRDVAVDVKVDEALIGGLVVRVGSRMMDGSIRTKLQNLQLAMKEVA
jgi:F-type H+-transporting ATPase subunit delta